MTGAGTRVTGGAFSVADGQTVSFFLVPEDVCIPDSLLHFSGVGFII